MTLRSVLFVGLVTAHALIAWIWAGTSALGPAIAASIYGPLFVLDALGPAGVRQRRVGRLGRAILVGMGVRSAGLGWHLVGRGGLAGAPALSLIGHAGGWRYRVSRPCAGRCPGRCASMVGPLRSRLI